VRHKGRRGRSEVAHDGGAVEDVDADGEGTAVSVIMMAHYSTVQWWTEGFRAATDDAAALSRMLTATSLSIPADPLWSAPHTRRPVHAAQPLGHLQEGGTGRGRKGEAMAQVHHTVTWGTRGMPHRRAVWTLTCQHL